MVKSLCVFIAAGLLGCGPIITSTSYRFEEKGVMDSTAATNNPEKVLKLHIDNYKDSIFPNDLISSCINVESMRIDAGHLAFTGKVNREIKIDAVKLRKLKVLHTLTFIGVQFSEFPTGLNVLDSLKKLTIYQAGLKSLPSDLSGFSNLQELDLTANYLSAIPEGLILDEALEKLVLQNNGLRVLPAKTFVDANLKVLRLDNIQGLHWGSTNKIAIVPEKINELLLNSNTRKIYIQASSCRELDRIYNLIKRKADRKRVYIVVYDSGPPCLLSRINGRLGTE